MACALVSPRKTQDMCEGSHKDTDGDLLSEYGDFLTTFQGGGGGRQRDLAHF